jgi:hypothetical protein
MGKEKEKEKEKKKKKKKMRPGFCRRVRAQTTKK